MKRYMVFAGDVFYPNGGMQDFLQDFDDLENAVEKAKVYVMNNGGPNGVWANVYDLENKEIHSSFGDERLWSAQDE